MAFSQAPGIQDADAPYLYALPIRPTYTAHLSGRARDYRGQHRRLPADVLGHHDLNPHPNPAKKGGAGRGRARGSDARVTDASLSPKDKTLNDARVIAASVILDPVFGWRVQ